MFIIPSWFVRLFAGLLLGGIVAPLALVALPDRWRHPYVPFLVGALCLVIAFSVRRSHRQNHHR
jgi:uncharacterized membrane protein YfcA